MTQNENIISIAAERYGVSQNDLNKLHGGYQNLNFEYTKDNSMYILRISKATTRTYEQIQSELEFIIHLSKFGISVSKPIKSIRENLIEEISQGKAKYFVTAFMKAVGEHIKYPDFLSKYNVFTELGRVTAKLHNASKEFPEELNHRVEWTDNYYLNSYKEFIPEDETEKIVSFDKQISEISSLWKNHNNFGLIHGDINVGNFFIDKQIITLFDFDECQNSWFVEDIAIQLFYVVYVFYDDSIEERNLKATQFMQNFLKGYGAETEIDIEMLKQIPRFLVLREMIVHVGIYKKWDLASLKGWNHDYFIDSSERIKKRIPIVEYNPEWHNFI